MNRPFTEQDDGKWFWYRGPNEAFRNMKGQLEFPLVDPESADKGEGILWFGSEGVDRGWDFAAPSDVEPVKETR